MTFACNLPHSPVCFKLSLYCLPHLKLCKSSANEPYTACLWQKEMDLYVFSTEGYFFPEYFQSAIIKSTVVKAQAWKAAVHTQDRKSLLFFKLLLCAAGFSCQTAFRALALQGRFAMASIDEDCPVWDVAQWVRCLGSELRDLSSGPYCSV